ncbi:MAG: biotin/lipoyl-binding protein [Clostridia bacterium]|nr:biotin/lipoyl-binding protein [Clostridia bacterium]MBR6335805.1 biotin/lipoyl-binding protein [Clostridia bacterium]
MKYVVTLNGKNYEVEVNETEAVLTGVSNAPAATAPAAAAPAAAAPVSAPSYEGAQVPAPMPGTILSVEVSAGQAVKTGDVLMILEAMKMENEIVSPCDGTVKQVLVQKGSTVDTGSMLAVIG